MRQRIPCTYSPPAPHIYNNSGWIRIWNPVGGLWWSFFAEATNMLRMLAVFAEEIHR